MGWRASRNLTVGMAVGALAACATEVTDLTRRASNTRTGAGTVPLEEERFREIETDLQKNCGRSCHDTGTTSPPAPTFLAAPNVYAAIKAYPGIVVRDVYASTLLTKGPHAGPAVSSDAEFEKRVIAWLEAESVAIQNQPLPTTPAFSVKLGPNDVDLSPACTPGLSGVHLEFEAALLGSMLALSKIVLVAPAGRDVHILQPRFVRILPKPGPDGTTSVADAADSFSNSDQTVAGGAKTTLSPGSVVFSHASWRPFDLAADKLRIEVTKLEPGKIPVAAPTKSCADVTAFTDNVLPALRGERGFNLDCAQSDCHGEAGTANLNLSGDDDARICQQVLSKLDESDIAKSLIVTKPTGNDHGGGRLFETNRWRQVFVDNRGAFF